MKRNEFVLLAVNGCALLSFVKAAPQFSEQTVSPFNAVSANAIDGNSTPVPIVSQSEVNNLDGSFNFR